MNILPSRRLTRATVTLGIALLAVLFLLPLYWMAVLATHTRSEVYQFPPPFFPGGSLVENFSRLTATVNALQALWNSFFVATASTILVLFFSSLAGYGFARYQQAPGHRWLFNIMLATIMIPTAAGIIPWFVEMKIFHWLNTYWPLIIPSAASAFGIFWMRQYIEEAIPFELYEAARLDGCSGWRVYWQIVVPLIGPGLAALAALTFLTSWNNFFIPLLVLNDQNLFTLPLALTSLNEVYATDVPAVMLGTAIGVLPILLMFVFTTRQFIAGLSNGAVKA
jgi:ABC-type glycerol-3-phosphate transport system permease component